VVPEGEKIQFLQWLERKWEPPVGEINTHQERMADRIVPHIRRGKGGGTYQATALGGSDAGTVRVHRSQERAAVAANG